MTTTPEQTTESKPKNRTNLILTIVLIVILFAAAVVCAILAVSMWRMYALQPEASATPTSMPLPTFTPMPGPTSTSPAEGVGVLDNTQWYLVSMAGQPTLAGTLISALFSINQDGLSGSFNGTSGCNSYYATFGGGLGVQTTMTSYYACSSPAGISEQEQQYMQAVAQTTGYNLVPDQLTLKSNLGELVYKQNPPPSAYDQAHLLQNVNWYLISINDKYSVPAKGEARVYFEATGAMSGFTGCSELVGAYTTNLANISITDLTSTQKACPNNASTKQQNAMMEGLRTARTYVVADTEMQIVADTAVMNFSKVPLNRENVVTPPTAKIVAPAEALTGQPVTLDGAQSEGVEAPIVSWIWDLGDGTQASGPVVIKIYDYPGMYKVKLTVTDDRGYSDPVKHELTIIQAPTPTAQPSVTLPPAPTATFTSTAVPPTSTTPPEQPTSTPVPVLPTDTPLPQPTATVAPAPTEPPAPVPPQAVIQGSATGYVAEPVSFSAQGSIPGSSPIASYTWNLGDGTVVGPVSNATVTNLYRMAGNYQVTVVVTDQNGLSDSASMNVEIRARLNTDVWTLEPILPGTAITLQFLAGKISGFAGCNTYSGSYTATDNGDGTYSVQISPLVTGQLSCPKDVMDQEKYYLTNFPAVTTASIQGNMLNLTYPGGYFTYYIVASPQPR